MRKDGWVPKQDWAVISGLLAGKKCPDLAREIGRTTGAVHARVNYLREHGLIHEDQTLKALHVRHINLQKKQRASRHLEEKKKWSREKKKEFAEDNRISGPSYIARQLGCSVQEVRELLDDKPVNETRTRPCSRCRKVFTTPHKCRFLCDSRNSYASSMGWF